MCGIAGIINLNRKPVQQESLAKMINIIRYRGPDDEGYFIDKNIGLGHCRLSIIDLTASAHQPMADNSQTFWIIHNGEVYNFIELRQELEALGYRFNSHSDTEVILYAYKAWGERCLDRFNGMWAFAIWNMQTKELFCARDRFGIKPFYYFSDGNIFAFSSEIKALLELKVSRYTNEALIYDFLKFGILDHTDKTFFREIKKLPAASWLKLDSSHKIVIHKYWDFVVSDRLSDRNRKVKDYTERFAQLFTDAVKLRLRSDVVVGSCLSGGLDSSSVVCVVNNLLKQEGISSIGEKQKVFSACFDEKHFDESDYIREVTEQTLVDTHCIFPRVKDFLSDLDNLLWHQEEPFAGSSIYAQWGVLRLAKEKKVKVILDGQGTDENLCGYRKFYIFYLRKLLAEGHYIQFLREAILLFSSPQVLATLYLKNGLRYSVIASRFINLDRFFKTEFLNSYRSRQIQFGYNTDLGRRIHDDLTKWSLPVLLRYEDKNSMAHSLETRLPFLDYRLVEFMASLPLNQKIRNGWTKFILRNAMRGILPEKVRLRKSKLGFDTPEKIWIRTYLAKHMRKVFTEAFFLPRYLNTDKLVSSFNKFLSDGRFLDHSIFFRCYILELWARKFGINEHG